MHIRKINLKKKKYEWIFAKIENARQFDILLNQYGVLNGAHVVIKTAMCKHILAFKCHRISVLIAKPKKKESEVLMVQLAVFT
jgi:hypothetical protein